MKLEKREITLNQTDSLTDVFYTEKNLTAHYTYALESVHRKETREQLLKLLKETGEDLYLAQDLMQRSRKEQESFNG